MCLTPREGSLISSDDFSGAGFSLWLAMRNSGSFMVMRLTCPENCYDDDSTAARVARNLCRTTTIPGDFLSIR
jgi:hypothetical protein